MDVYCNLFLKGRRQMRYSRLRRSRSRRSYVSVFIVGLLLFSAFYFLSAGAVGRYISQIIGPILEEGHNRNETENEGGSDKSGTQVGKKEIELTLPKSQTDDELQNQELKESRITESIKIEPMVYYAIQVGAFNGIENAKILAQDIKQKGGAGYIIEDEYYRVIAMAYASETDCLSVKEQLKDQGVESQIYKIASSGVNMEVTATKDKIEGIRSSFNIWKEKASLLENLIRELDTNKITGEISLNRLRDIREEMVTQRDKIGEYIKTNEGNRILVELHKLYENQINNLDQILQVNINDRLAISSNMKYNYIDMIYQFNRYIEKIIGA